jgi:hypothetical protein
MNFASLIAAFAVPDDSLVEQRVPKKLMLEQGAPTPADKRAIQDGIEELFWVAALKPTNIGVPAYRDETREYLEIELLTAVFRGDAKAARLTELVHRAIPYPLLLLSAHEGVCTLSVAHKRWSQGETGKVVIEDLHCSSSFQPDASKSEETAFIASLKLSTLPRESLFVLYQGWLDRVTAMAAAHISGVYTVPTASEQSQDLRDGLEAHDRIERELVSLRARAKKEKQMNRRVELNVELKRLEGELARLGERLGGIVHEETRIK